MVPRPFVDNDLGLGDRNFVAALLRFRERENKAGATSEAASLQRGSKHHSNVVPENPTDAQ
jgi:hypothetical protein